MSQVTNRPTRCPRTMHSLMATIVVSAPGASLLPPPAPTPDVAGPFAR